MRHGGVYLNDQHNVKVKNVRSDHKVDKILKQTENKEKEQNVIFNPLEKKKLHFVSGGLCGFSVEKHTGRRTGYGTLRKVKT